MEESQSDVKHHIVFPGQEAARAAHESHTLVLQGMAVKGSSSRSPCRDGTHGRGSRE